MSCLRSVELSAYVLDALEEPEARAVERHLADCHDCNDELPSLAFTASLLSLLQPDEVEQLASPDPSDPSASGRVRAGRVRTGLGRPPMPGRRSGWPRRTEAPPST